MRRVVVTGMGAVTPIGNDVDSMWKAAKNGLCGIGEITHYDHTNHKVSLAAEVKDFDPNRYLDRSEVRRLDDFCIYALTAACEAMEDSKIDMKKEDPLRCGVIFSSGIGGMTSIQREDMRGMQKGYDRVNPHFIPMVISNMAAGHIAMKFGFNGICSCVVTACAGSGNAIGDSFRQIKFGFNDIMICGGAEASITPLGIGGFTSMNALSTSRDPLRASIPFDKERNGFVMGEGAGALILEEYEHAINRGAKIYCEIKGYGVSCDAHHVTAPLEDGSMAAVCMEKAMEEANVTCEDIDYINAHGTSTQLNDRCETRAVKRALKESACDVMMSSTKSLTGHLLGASGAVESILTSLMVEHDTVIATANYKVKDEECDLDIVPNKARNTKVDIALSNSFGFGGHNVSLLFGKVR
ncbi:MAG: beta-ketoacyl-ACP synthase II [Lachnospiraceae bacterium]|nr:beta-ketoacyl-ACP synthase II [Lachnospiraceae bacterium]